MEENNYQRRKADEQFINHEKRIIVVEVVVQRLDDHHKDDLLVLKGIGEKLRELDERIVVVTKEQNGTFTEDQVRGIKELFDERAEVHAGRLAFRAILYAIGLFVAGSASALLVYLGFKK